MASAIFFVIVFSFLILKNFYKALFFRCGNGLDHEHATLANCHHAHERARFQRVVNGGYCAELAVAFLHGDVYLARARGKRGDRDIDLSYLADAVFYINITA